MTNIIKKDRLKNKLSFLLALPILCNFLQPFCATAAFSDISTSKENISEAQSELSLDSPEEQSAEISDATYSEVGRIDITIGMALFMQNNVDFIVTLTGINGYMQNKTVSVGSSEEEKISFDSLEDGEYTIAIDSPGFATYNQNITVAKKLYSIQLTAGFCEGYTYEQNGLHPGVLLIGDVDNDGDVDEQDKEILVDAIDGRTIPDGCFTDLNQDNEINLIDLSLFAKGYAEYRDTLASVEEFISPQAIKTTVSENTIVEGSLEYLLNGEDTVILTPSDEGEISETNPVSMEFDFMDNENTAVVDGITFETGSNNPVSEAFIDVAYIENGEEQRITVPVKSNVNFLLKESDVYAELDTQGNIHVHLGNQVAVKKVTLTITAMQNEHNLAEISKVEFVNGMESRIPEPEMDIPQNLTAEAGSENFVLKWDACVNVTGYEVKIQQGDEIKTVIAISNSIQVSSFGEQNIENYTTYRVSVQSINGTWKSGYGDFVDVTPKPTSPPDKPDNVSAIGKYKSIIVSWKDMDNTLTYNLFYKKRESADAYIQISGIQENRYTIPELDDLTEYEIYVTGVNELGESPASIHCAAKTTDLNAAEVPRYHIINRDENGVPGSAHIVSVTRNGGSMIDSEADANSNNSAWGTVDNNAASYYSKTTWDDGGFNNLGNNGLIYTFDQEYIIDQVALLATEGMQYSYVKVRWWDDDGNTASSSASVGLRKDAEGRNYYVIQLPYAVTANKIQIGLARYLAGGAYNLITVAEAYFYCYDFLRDEIMDLYADDLHTILKDEVTQETIDDLREKVNTPDEFGEENSNKAALLRELETAEKILNDGALNSSVKIHPGITTKDTGRGFSGLNAWQPLGISAAIGDTITVYVGHSTKKTGESTDLRLIATQYHSESGGVITSGANLKIGANEITLPKTNSSIGSESGGALYIQYQGGNPNDRYAVRVSGGTEVPYLDLYQVTDEQERMERTVHYIEALDKYVPAMESLHNEIHSNSDNQNVNYSYDAKNCILGATDILLDTMMISVPAPQVLAGSGNGSSKERAETILDSIKSMEDMVYLFYQHKGLNASALDALDQIPKGHLNIRYQRMFSGAFMYAAGNHIGIEWNETRGMVNCSPVVTDENGRYISGHYFGWGIAHEIGHCINQGSYAVAEITNNYFAQLAQAKDTNTGMRFQYSNIYQKVTSGTKGNASNIATQLGMYWQLHLAYDKGFNYKTYTDYSEQFSNLFYARVDTYARNTKKAPAPDGIALTLGNNTDQNLMRLACAAAEKNILEFFERWGKTPDTETIAYANQFEKETRAIFYANDDSRIYALNGEGSVLDTSNSVSAIQNVAVSIGTAANQVELKFTPENISANDILGYEITRCTISDGKVEKSPVGFATSSTYTDTITTMNNRTVYYQVILIDQYLNRSAIFTTDMVKIEHDGSMDKTNWSITTVGLTAETMVSDATDEMPCEQIKNNPAEQAIDHNVKTIYNPTVDENKAEIIIDFHQTLTTTGLKYTTGNDTLIEEYEIYVMSEDTWTLVAEGSCKGSETIYFANDDDKYISTYAATALKFVILNQKDQTISIAELDVLGVTGDNVDFRKTATEKTAVIGILSEDYQYGENSEEVIPKDSLIFTGSYKGNPAYNVVLLYDNDGNVVGGMDKENHITAQQIILADVPDDSNIANVSDGTWIYWIEPKDWKNMELPEMVRAELYRVNNALTNEGQRLVSDSLFEKIPDTLPSISLEQ